MARGRLRALDTFIPYYSVVAVTDGLAPAPSLLHALVRECRDMSPTLESRVSGPLGRHGVLDFWWVWAGWLAGWLRPEYYVMLCYVASSTYTKI